MNRFLRKAVDHIEHDPTKGFEVSSGQKWSVVLSGALAHHRAGRWSAAMDVYQDVLAEDPTERDALFLKGVWHEVKGELEEASENLRQLVVAHPDFALGWSQYGSVLSRMGELDGALAAFSRASELEPNRAEGYVRLAEVYQDRGDAASAMKNFQLATSIDPSFSHAFVGLAKSWSTLGHYDEAVGACHRAILANPKSSEAYDMMGLALSALGQGAAAVDAFHSAIKLNPSNAAAFSHLGQIYLELREPSKALEMAVQAMQLDDALLDAHLVRAEALRELGRLDEALTAVSMARTETAQSVYIRGCIVFDLGRPEEAAEHFRDALRRDPHHARAHSRLLQAMQGSTASGEEILMVAEDWGRKFSFSRYSPKPPISDIKRIGFVAGELGVHPIGCLVEGLFREVNRGDFETFVYANQAQTDAHSEVLRRSVDVWRSVSGVDDDTLTQIIEEDRIDALVDLSGHNRSNRLQVFANHAAPVQVSWLGHAGTTGLPQMDAVIGDDVTIPADLASCYAERTVRLATPWTCYVPPKIDKGVGDLPCLSGEPFTFGVFAQTSMFNKGSVAVWAEILSRVAGSRILIKSRNLVSKGLQRQILGWFQEGGIKPDRVVFRQSSSWAMHFGSFDQVDLLLDTVPFNSPLTVLEGLWSGVPTLTLLGRQQHERLSTSALEEVDLHGFVMESTDEYADRAVALANDIHLLKDLRGELRGRLLGSRLCDCRSFARGFTSALQGLV